MRISYGIITLFFRGYTLGTHAFPLNNNPGNDVKIFPLMDTVIFSKNLPATAIVTTSSHGCNNFVTSL